MIVTLVRLGLLALVIAGLSGCSGSDGAAGPAGATGTIGGVGPQGPTGPTGGGNVANMTPTQWANLQLTGQVTGASIPTGTGKAVVNFKVADVNGTPITGLGSRNPTNLANLSFTIGKLVPGPCGTSVLAPGCSPSKWVSYVVVGATGTVGKPSTENNGTLLDNGDGSYVYTFDRRIDGGASSVQETVNNFVNTGTAGSVITSGTAKLCGSTTQSTDKCGAQDKADLGDLTYDPNLTHRIAILISGNARGTGTNTPDGSTSATTAVPIKTPINLVYDFVPATGTMVAQTETDGTKQRNVVDVRNCFTCHSKFTFHGQSNQLLGIAGSRQDTRVCVLCHTDQRKFGVPNSVTTATTVSYPTGMPAYTSNGVAQTAGDRMNILSSAGTGESIKNLPVWIHKIHMGEELVKTGYWVNSIALNETKFPQNLRSCAKCHSDYDGATGGNTVPQAANWKTKPSRLACGACHDGIDFATGTGTTVAGLTSGHLGGQHTDDTKCVNCHVAAADGGAETMGTGILIEAMHKPVTPIDPNNAFLTGQTPAAVGTYPSYSGGTAPVVGCNQLVGGDGGTPVPPGTSPTPIPNCNANTIAAAASTYVNNLPAGAKRIVWNVKSVNVSATGQPMITFRFDDMTSGTASPVVFNTAPAATPTSFAGEVELMAGFVGSPSVQFVAAVPQDGIAQPSDYNWSASAYIRTCFNKLATSGSGKCTMTGPTSGYYTITLDGTKLPQNATMYTGGIGFTYSVPGTLPLTQTDVPGYAYTQNPPTLNGGRFGTGGFMVPAPNVMKLGSGPELVTTSDGTFPTWLNSFNADGTRYSNTARRTIVEAARCNNCHNQLGLFSSTQFHAGQRNDPQYCVVCHNPNRTSSGWSASSNSYIHAIHGGAKRTVPFTWHATSTTDGFFSIGYPGILRNCQQCHQPNTVNYGNTANSNAAWNGQLLSSTVATGRFATAAGATTSVYASNYGGCATAYPSAPQTALGVFSLSPYISKTNDQNYGVGFTANASATASQPTCDGAGGSFTVPGAGTREADGSTLVNSPVTNACFACHTTDTAISHMKANGGVLYATRDSLAGTSGAGAYAAWVAAGNKLPNPEQCLVCHAAGRVADAEAVHAQTFR